MCIILQNKIRVLKAKRGELTSGWCLEISFGAAPAAATTAAARDFDCRCTPLPGLRELHDHKVPDTLVMMLCVHLLVAW